MRQLKYIKLFESPYGMSQENWIKFNEITDFMSFYGIKDYTFNKKDLSVDIHEFFEIPDEHEHEKFPFKINTAKEFYWYDGKLKTLEGGPKEVLDYFVYKNELTSLEFAPTIISDWGAFSYFDNPCWDDENQLKYIPLISMMKGNVWNFENEDGESRFFLPFKTLDEYWDEQIQKEETVFMELVVSYGMGSSSESNQISPKLYNKYKYLDRGKNTGMWDAKIKSKK